MAPVSKGGRMEGMRAYIVINRQAIFGFMEHTLEYDEYHTK